MNIVSHEPQYAVLPLHPQWGERCEDVLEAGRVLFYAVTASECAVGFPLVLWGSG